MIIFYRNHPDNLRNLFIAQALDLNQSTRAQQRLNDLRITALVVCKLESLDPFIRLNKIDQQ